MELSDLRDTTREIANVDENRLPDTILNLYLNESVKDIMDLHRLRFGEAYITTAFVADTQTINPAPLSGVILHPTAMWYPDSSGERVDVDQISWAKYVQHYGTAAQADEGTGDPSHFALYGEDGNGNPTFYLGPIPDEDRTVYLTARITFLDLVEDDSSNQLTVREPLAVIYRALTMAASHLESAERIPEWETAFQRIMKRISLTHDGARYSAKHANQMQEPG